MNLVKKLGPEELRLVYREHIREDFPRSERRPLFAMERMQRAERYDCYGYYRDGSLSAYACYILTKSGSYSLLDYFAVIPELRGHGIGGEFLRGLQGAVSASCGVFLEAESPDSATSEEEKRLRERRIRFYLSNGAELTNTNCLLFGVDYSILFLASSGAGRPAEADHLHHAVEELYRELYGRAYGRLCRPYERGAS